MKRYRQVFLLQLVLVLVAVFLSRTAFGWGFWAHKEINRQAIQSLPPPLKDFFLANEEYVVEHSTDPDQRRFTDKDEQFYHFLDIDRYGKYPFSELPHDYQEAVKRFGADSLKKNGLLPWHIAEVTDRLAGAMKLGDKGEILHLAADLGHYVSDAHVPLHATENYDGQLSGQIGVHARFESRLPEMYGKEYHFFHDSAKVIENPLEKAFQIVFLSCVMADSVLKADASAKEDLKGQEIYTVVKKDGKKEYKYSDAYYEKFNEHLHGLVERRIQDAILAVADYWLTAWVKAGKPDLPT
ncbi:MAG: zinc dependent phospholipase C family protein [Bacteroidota bacterium]